MNPEPGKPEPSKQLPLILLPGMGGDSRLFRPQRAVVPDLIVPTWIEPRPKESLVDYAGRFAKVIDPGRPCFIGGVSFGGVVALEVATHLMTRECFLFGSIRSPLELPQRLKMFRSISDLVMIPKWLSPCVLACGRQFLNPTVRGALHQVRDADGRFLRWAAQAILRWTPSEGVQNVRISQIHGSRDRVFPSRLTRADQIVAGAGHLVSLTHPDIVNQFLIERMSRVVD